MGAFAALVGLVLFVLLTSLFLWRLCSKRKETIEAPESRGNRYLVAGRPACARRPVLLAAVRAGRMTVGVLGAASGAAQRPCS